MNVYLRKSINVGATSRACVPWGKSSHRGREGQEMPRNVANSGQKWVGSEVNIRVRSEIRKIKPPQGRIALAHEVFQQPVRE